MVREILLSLPMLIAGCTLFGSTDDVVLGEDPDATSSDARPSSGDTAAVRDGSNSDAPGGHPDTGIDMLLNDVGSDLRVADMPTDGSGDMLPSDVAADMGGDASDAGVTGSGCGGAMLVDVSSPNVVVGQGTPQSCDEQGLRNGLAAGGIVTFNCGGAAHEIVVTQPLDVTTSVTIDGGDLITISGGGASRLFVIDVATPNPLPLLRLQRLRLKEGYAEVADRRCGAAVHKTGGTLVSVDVDFVSNECSTSDVASPARGGALFLVGGDATELRRVRFTNNGADEGGAVSTVNHELFANDSEFLGNHSTSHGGAIHAIGGQVHVCGSHFANQQADAEGGALWFAATAASDPLVSISRSSFVGNTGAALGGAVYTYGSTTSIERSWFDGNHAGGAGAARLMEGEIEITNSTFHANVAETASGGALRLANVTGSVTNVTMVDNQVLNSLSFGGAIFGGTGVTLSNSAFVGNYAANVYEDQTCSEVMSDGGGNIQHPSKNPAGEDDGPCAAGVLIADPKLGALDAQLGVNRPLNGSPALGYGDDCPSVDQLGDTRPAIGCTSGAVENP